MCCGGHCHGARAGGRSGRERAARLDRFGLAAGLFTRDLARAHRVAARLEAGILWINNYNITPIEMPFGGIKESGNGHREAGHAALDTFTEWKSIYVDFSGRLQKAQIDNQDTP